MPPSKGAGPQKSYLFVTPTYADTISHTAIKFTTGIQRRSRHVYGWVLQNWRWKFLGPADTEISAKIIRQLHAAVISTLSLSICAIYTDCHSRFY